MRKELILSILAILAIGLAITSLVISLNSKQDRHTQANQLRLIQEHQALQTKVASLEASLGTLAVSQGELAELLARATTHANNVTAYDRDRSAADAVGVQLPTERSTPPLANPQISPQTQAAATRVIGELAKRHIDLENDLSDLGVLEHFAKRKEAVAQAQLTVLDSTLTSRQRIEALGKLKEVGKMSTEVIDSMAALWDEEEDPFARWYLMDNLEGVVDEGIRDRLIGYLPTQPSAKMRGRALETLAPMLGDPLVDAVFATMAESDPDPKVQQQALTNLETARRAASSTKTE